MTDNILAEVNASIENQDMPYRRKEEQYSTFRQALLTNQEKGIEIEQAKPGRTYSGEIVTISENTIIQQSKLIKSSNMNQKLNWYRKQRRG